VPDDLLTGVRVLDLSQYLPGPYAARMLADMGADVIKVEPPGGDPLFHMNPVTGERAPGAGAACYMALNGSKTVLTLDLKGDDGKEGLRALLEAADVLLESYRPGVLARLGFDRTLLQDLNPGLVHVALSGYGQDGPSAALGGHDINYMARSGSLLATGPKERPLMNWPPVADLSGAMQTVIVAQGALYRRANTGQGAYIDVAMADVALAWQDWGLTAALRLEDDVGREGCLLNGGAACYRVYATMDGRFVALGALEEKFWSNFCEAAGRPEWIARLSEPLPQAPLIAEVAALFASRTLDAWKELLGGVDCCFEPVLDYAEAAEKDAGGRRLISRNGDWTSVLFPALVDGKGPGERPKGAHINLSDAIKKWS